LRSRTLLNELVVDISYLATPYPNHLDTDDIQYPECSLNPLLSNSEQQSLEFHSTLSFVGNSLVFSMTSTPYMTYGVLLVVPASLPNWFLVLPPKNGLNTFSVSNQGS
jgi:hypothetical protein